MGFPGIYEDVFENGGEGPLIRPDVLPDIELTGDTTGTASCGEDGKWTVETTTPMTVTLTGDVTGTGTVEDSIITVNTSAASASHLETARKITLFGDVTGEAEFDGSEDIVINTTGLFSDMSNTTDRLKDPITVTLDGDAEGSADFDGSSDLTIHTTVSTSATSALANEATKLETERTIQLIGDTSGSFTFDGTEDKTVTLTTDVATQLREGQYVTLTGPISGKSSAPFNGTDEIVISTEFSAGDGPMVPSADEPTQIYTSMWYTAETNGYIIIQYGCVQPCYVNVDNFTYRFFLGYDEAGVAYIPVAKGQSYNFVYEDTWNGIPCAWWLPAY